MSLGWGPEEGRSALGLREVKVQGLSRAEGFFLFITKFVTQIQLIGSKNSPDSFNPDPCRYKDVSHVPSQGSPS